MMVGFALSWIPYVDFVAGIVALVGLIFLVLGRWGFGLRHAQFVVVSLVVLVVAGLVDFGVIIGVAAEVASTAGQPGVTLSQIGSELNASLLTLFVATAVLAVVGSIAEVLLVEAIADRTSKVLLWLGVLANAALAVVTVVWLLPQVQGAVAEATSGTSVNLGPINALETTSTLFGLTHVVPSVLFVWAYYRVREAVITDRLPRTGTSLR